MSEVLKFNAGQSLPVDDRMEKKGVEGRLVR